MRDERPSARPPCHPGYRRRPQAGAGQKRPEAAFFTPPGGPHFYPMKIHGSCAARDGAGVLFLGPPGSGKSDLLLRLLDRGFVLVADDRVEIDGGVARAPETLSGLLE